MGNYKSKQKSITLTITSEYHDNGIDIVNNNKSRTYFSTRNRHQNPIENTRMRVDIAAYGSYDNGFYKNVPWEMQRFMIKGYPEHWCGYVLYNGNLTKIELELIEEKIHEDLTYYMGFECNHCYDYNYNHKGTYRDHEYVINCIREMIDVLVKTKSFDKTKIRAFMI
jgi:hypothetical protein